MLSWEMKSLSVQNTIIYWEKRELRNTILSNLQENLIYLGWCVELAQS